MAPFKEWNNQPMVLGDLNSQNPSPKLPDSSQLPKPELNPLLNPLLEKNLGRWAQVYFATPPEGREQAVLELLQELKAQDSATGGAAASSATHAHEPAGETIVCPACDAKNRSQQRYCGFCGSTLRPRESAPSPSQTRSLSSEVHEPETFSVLGLSSMPPPKEKTPSATMGSPIDRKLEGSLQFLREKDFELYESEPGHVRRYVLLAIAIVLAASMYIKWPSIQSRVRSSLHAAVAAPAATAEGSRAANPPSGTVLPAPSNTPAPATSSSSEQAPPVEQPAAPEVPDSSLNVSRNPVPAVMSSRSHEAAAPADSTNPPAIPDGVQELVLAQRYLDGKGEPRDAAAAARLLWQSVSKQNPRAALVLADLYERGDGVAKSCGQARILLGVAEDRGMPQATEKLRNLNVSCH